MAVDPKKAKDIIAASLAALDDGEEIVFLDLGGDFDLANVYTERRGDFIYTMAPDLGTSIISSKGNAPRVMYTPDGRTYERSEVPDTPSGESEYWCRKQGEATPLVVRRGDTIYAWDGGVIGRVRKKR